VRACCQQRTLARNDDGSVQATLPFNISFFGVVTDAVWLNNNGNVAPYDKLQAFTPWQLVGNQIPMMAVFFADVDTRADSPVSPVTYGSGVIGGRRVWCANWLEVSHFHKGTVRNSMQLCLHDASGATGVRGDFDGVQLRQHSLGDGPSLGRRFERHRRLVRAHGVDQRRGGVLGGGRLWRVRRVP
jgi:hypothetical protein